MGSPDIIAPSTTSGGSPVGGSGTPGTIPRWDTGTTLTDSPLTVSGTTVTATQAFTVNGTQTFNGNLVSGFNQTWTLNGGFLNIQSGLLYLDKTNSRIGIGTASPSAKLHAVAPDGTPYPLAISGTTKGLRVQTTASQVQIEGVDNTLVGSFQPLFLNGSTLTLAVSGSPALTVQATTGNVGIGTASPTDRVTVNGGGLAITGNVTGNTQTANTAVVDNIGGTTRVFSIGPNASTNGSYNFYIGKSGGSPGYTSAIAVDSSGNTGIGTASPGAKLEVPYSATLAGMRIQVGAAPKLNFFNAEGHYFRNLSDQNRVAIDTVNNYIDASLAAGWGLKLPATPGNGDASTIDCYQENPLASTAGNGWTPTLSVAATWGGTQPTVDYARYIRIGSLVFCEVRLSGAAISATYGSTTISQPPVTMNAFAYESAVSVSTGVGSGVGVCTSTSVLLPTLGATAVMRLSWFYFTTS